MTSSRALHKNLLYHTAVGTLFALLLFSALLLAGYRDGLVKAEDSLVRIRRNTVMMEASREEFKDKKRLVGSVIPAGYQARSNRALMLIALEDARAEIAGAKLSVTDFVEEDGELVLPLVFEFPVNNYGDALKAVGYLEGMALPYFSPAGVTIRRVEGRERVEGRIEGSLRMPAGKMSAVNGG